MNNLNDKHDLNKELPPAFLARMREQLGSEYDDFLAGYSKERTYGLRYNPLKLDRKSFLKNVPFALREIPWAEEGFYYEAAWQPGKHALHDAGAFYIQEPSAMAVVSVLDPKPGERILDLCAAPGGKSTQIAGRMHGDGLLVSNEIVPSRAKILSQNIERMGVANCVVCREEPGHLANFFSAFFDRVLVDAPCSGEGMFRKDDTAIAEWSPDNVAMCAARQRDILEQASGMVRPGGVLVYSTCTFSIEENEGVISDFVKSHPDYNIEETLRLWPHCIEGEGHFIAELRREDEPTRTDYRVTAEEIAPIHKKSRGKDKFSGKGRENACKGSCKAKEQDKTAQELCMDFLRNELGLTDSCTERLFKERMLFNFGESLYLIPQQMIPLEGLQVERPGLQLGLCEKGRFKPSHALALFLHPEDVRKHYVMTQEQTACYLRGETFAVGSDLKGWYLLSGYGCSMGFGKATGGQMKNHYPKGLRRTYT